MTKYTIDDWMAVKKNLSRGHSIRGCANITGVSRGAVFRWKSSDRPPDGIFKTMIEVNPLNPPGLSSKNNKRLSYEQRAYIAALKDCGHTLSSIAKKIGMHRTTVARELARAGDGDYDPIIAQKDSWEKSRRPKRRKLDVNRELRSYVIAKLLLKWSPEQISKSIAREFPDQPEMHVSAETIYQAIYIQGKGSLRQELAVEQALRSGKSRRKPQSKMPKRARGSSWVEGCEISKRPKEAEDRAIPGHWEGDLIIGGDHKSCLVTLVERKTRFLVARRLTTHDTKTVVDLLISMAQSIPEEIRDALVSTLTWDQGSELADAARFSLATGFKVYFCDPHSPWQKGTNENTNGLIRQYFPKGTKFTKVTDEEVQEMQDQMNGRPRKTLDWASPAEALSKELIKANRAMTA